MDGVTIIGLANSFPMWGLVLSCTILTIATLAGVGIAIWVLHKTRDEADRVTEAVNIFWVVVSLAFLGGSIWGLTDQYNKVKDDCIVTVNESVSFSEFMDNYEIIERDGDQYTVRPIQ